MALVNERVFSRTKTETRLEVVRTREWIGEYVGLEAIAPVMGAVYNDGVVADPICKCIETAIKRIPESGQVGNPQGHCILTATYSTKMAGPGPAQVLREWDMMAETITDFKDLDLKTIHGGAAKYQPRVVYTYTRWEQNPPFGDIYALTGTVNSAAFLGEVAYSWLFLGARILREDREYYRSNYQFAYRPVDPASGKWGWRTVKTYEVEGPGGESKTDVHRVYEARDFTPLGVS